MLTGYVFITQRNNHSKLWRIFIFTLVQLSIMQLY